MKKLINDPGSVVPQMIAGLVAAYPNVRKLPGFNVLVRADADAVRDERVAIVSGGGSGHEPAHAGYVGRGMLSGAVAGDVFTSPAPDAVLAAIKAVTGKAGCLLIVKNYTGDRLNFGLAAERARAEGLQVEIIIVADDAAPIDSAAHTGARGLAGTVLVHKIAGAAAEAGLDLASVAAEARAAAADVRTMGVALSACTVPAAGRPGFALGETEIEMGLGIHGEPGVSRGPIATADALVDAMLERIAAAGAVQGASSVVLMVNGLGGTPAMELAIVARHAVEALEGRGAAVERVYLGNFLTALEMAGVSLSVLRVDPARLDRLDAPTTAPAWSPSPGRPRERAAEEPDRAHATPTAEHAAIPPRTDTGRAVGAALRRAADALIAAEAELTASDQVVGDGDMGISLSRGARAILAAIPTLPLDDPSATAKALSAIVEHALGGTSGPLYAAFLLRAATALDRDPADWAGAFRAGCSAMHDLGGASAGDRTMLDALLPASEAFSRAITSGRTPAEALALAAAAARDGARSTSQMLPKRGRSSYLGPRALNHPDPGAEAVAIWLAALVPPGAPG